MSAIPVHRTAIILRPDSSRVLIRPFLLDNPTRVRSLLTRLQALSDAEVREAIGLALTDFERRHVGMPRILRRHYEKARAYFPEGTDLSPERQQLLGAYLTSEYALESAALFNPSIVLAPEQEGVSAGEVRFVMSLRATGEGHISSIEFRSGVIKAAGAVEIDPVTPFVVEPERIESATYDAPLFSRKLAEIGFDNEFSRGILDALGDTFTFGELSAALEAAPPDPENRERQRTSEGLMLLAQANYETRFPSGHPICERIIFPSSPTERNGIEDARFVRFEEADGSVVYYATYTAYDGKVILPQLLETRDFLHFKISTLNGPAAQNKGMALFPRKIDGLYAMVSRQDNENLFLMYSDNLHFWFERQPLMGPEAPWELVQLGNCGSPIETEAGWLVLTHGVGPMRRYCIGAILLDLDDPSRIIGRLREPLLTPEENERAGYVPNVVYTCGALVHGGNLILPYAMSDYATGIATVEMRALLAALLEGG